MPRISYKTHCISPSLIFLDDVAGCNLSAKLIDAIKQKCSTEELMGILKEVGDEEQDDRYNSLKVNFRLVNGVRTWFN